MQYIKDRIVEGFDDYFSCRKKKKRDLKYLTNWFNLFVEYYNKEIMS
jgi:hypothetical protein